jgi:hypothetical protein
MSDCFIEDQLLRINRLSEIALEFHGEVLGEVAEDTLIDTALGLAEFKDDVALQEKDLVDTAAEGN